METNELAEALGKAQSEFGAVKKDKTAKVKGKTKSGADYEYTYQYADLSSVIEVAKTVLHKHGLGFTQVPVMRDGAFLLETVVMHKSGGSITGYWPLPVQASPQEMGSALTYAKRYSLSAMLGIAAEEDDDGQAGNDTKAKLPQAKNTPEAVAKEAGRVQETKTNKNILLNLPSGEAKPFMSMTAYLDAFDTELSNTDDQPAFFDLNSSTLGELQAKAVAAKNKQGDAIAARITEIYDRIRALEFDPLKGA